MQVNVGSENFLGSPVAVVQDHDIDPPSQISKEWCVIITLELYPEVYTVIIL